MQEFECPVCREIVFSGIGEGCKMCGMPLESRKDFCCVDCEEKYFQINE